MNIKIFTKKDIVKIKKTLEKPRVFKWTVRGSNLPTIENPLKTNRFSDLFRIYPYYGSEAFMLLTTSGREFDPRPVEISVKIKKTLEKPRVFKWTVRGSNSRHSGCKPDARTS